MISLGFLLPFQGIANCLKLPGERIQMKREVVLNVWNGMNDTIPASKPAELPSKEKPVAGTVTEKATAVIPNEENKENGIKAVPKSRKQSKPRVVNTNIEVKPIRVIKPKIIRKIVPLG